MGNGSQRVAVTMKTFDDPAFRIDICGCSIRFREGLKADRLTAQASIAIGKRIAQHRTRSEDTKGDYRLIICELRWTSESVDVFEDFAYELLGG